MGEKTDIKYFHIYLEGAIPSEVAYLKCKVALSRFTDSEKIRILMRIAGEIEEYSNHRMKEHV